MPGTWHQNAEMQLAVLGASGLVGRVCIDELSRRGVDVLPLHRDDAIGRVRINKKTTDLVVCGDQSLCRTAIPAVQLILGA